LNFVFCKSVKVKGWADISGTIHPVEIYNTFLECSDQYKIDGILCKIFYIYILYILLRFSHFVVVESY